MADGLWDYEWGRGGRRVWGSYQDFRHPPLDRHAGLCVILQLWWEGRCRELLVGSEGYFGKLPWCRAGGVLREVCKVGGGGKQARWGIGERPAGWGRRVLLLGIDRWWPQQLQPTTQHLVRAI